MQLQCLRNGLDAFGRRMRVTDAGGFPPAQQRLHSYRWSFTNCADLRLALGKLAAADGPYPPAAARCRTPWLQGSSAVGATIYLVFKASDILPFTAEKQEQLAQALVNTMGVHAAYTSASVVTELDGTSPPVRARGLLARSGTISGRRSLQGGVPH